MLGFIFHCQTSCCVPKGEGFSMSDGCRVVQLVWEGRRRQCHTGLPLGPDICRWWIHRGCDTRAGRIKDNSRDKESTSHSWNPDAARTGLAASWESLWQEGENSSEMLQLPEENECGSILGSPGEMALWELRG